MCSTWLFPPACSLESFQLYDQIPTFLISPQLQLLFLRVGSGIPSFPHNFIYIRNHMESKIIVSRSVVIDPVFKKSQEQNYEKHKQKLLEIKKRKVENEGFDIDQVIKRKLSVKLAHQKVKDELDPHHFEKKAMINHIKTILERKGDNFLEIKKYKNSALQNEKKEIERRNKILSDKIKQGKAHKITKKELRRQFAQYESQKNLIRKVWYESTRTSLRKKQKSLERLSLDHSHK